MTKKSPRVSTSFSLDQTILLDEILSIMLRGGDPKLLRRNKAFGTLCNTAKSLRRRAENPSERPKSTPPSAVEVAGNVPEEAVAHLLTVLDQPVPTEAVADT